MGSAAVSLILLNKNITNKWPVSANGPLFSTSSTNAFLSHKNVQITKFTLVMDANARQGSSETQSQIFVSVLVCHLKNSSMRLGNVNARQVMDITK